MSHHAPEGDGPVPMYYSNTGTRTVLSAQEALRKCDRTHVPEPLPNHRLVHADVRRGQVPPWGTELVARLE
jgi:hypothetical protein